MTDYSTRTARAALEAEFDALPVESDEGGGAPVSTVISVRLRADELAAVEAAAEKAGVPLSSFIRAAAISAAHPIDHRAIVSQAEAVVDEAIKLADILRVAP